MPEHGGSPGEDADPVASEPEPDCGRHEALEHVEHRDRQAQVAAVDAPDVRRADVSAAMAPDVVATKEAGEEIAEGDGADEVGGEDD